MIYHIYFLTFAAMGLMVEWVVEVAVLTKVMVSPLARATANRVMEATTRALTAAVLALTTKEDMAVMASPSQVEANFKKLYFWGTYCDIICFNLHVWSSSFLLGGYSSPPSNQGGGGGYSHSSQPYSSGGYSSSNQSSNMTYNQQSSFSGYGQQQSSSSSSAGLDTIKTQII